MTVLTEARRPGEFILSEAAGQRSRAAVTVAAEQTIEPNTVLARKAVAASVAAVASADAGNTASSGTIAMDATAVTSIVKDGRYIGIAVAATKVEWSDPDGVAIGISTHGSLFNKGGIRLTITAGGTPNVAGDRFYVDVAADAGDFQWVAFDQDGTDGSQDAAGIAIHGAVTGVGETKEIAAMVRDMEANGNCLVWPDDIEDAEKVNAEQALEELGIIVRY